jgi:hypothetical protein
MNGPGRKTVDTALETDQLGKLGGDHGGSGLLDHKYQGSITSPNSAGM